MLNFAVGPVQSGGEVLRIGQEQVPYFRTPEFSALMLENEVLMKKFTGAEEEARTVFLTGSGTAAMEAAVMNCLSGGDKALVVNGGSFGQRFADLCRLHGIPFDEISLEAGKPLTAEALAPYDGKGYTCFLINLHETSTGVLYDAGLVEDFCARNRLFLIVDAISALLADPFNMGEMGADAVIASSQKALACPPGISTLVLSPRALERVEHSSAACMYFDLKSALKNGERGQTPFTPAVGILLQLNARLREIDRQGGAGGEIQRTAALARDFRDKIEDLPLTIFSDSLSNAVTPLHPLRASAREIFTVLKDEYGIWVCPNGGALAEKVFRVGHLGALTPEDNTTLVNALKDLERRGIL